MFKLKKMSTSPEKIFSIDIEGIRISDLNFSKLNPSFGSKIFKNFCKNFSINLSQPKT
jgi:hypothetical protein